MGKKEKPIYVFPSDKLFFILIGISLIVIFFIIYAICAIKIGKFDYFSLFFNNIINHILITILVGFHIGLLGIGILFIIFAFFNLTPKIKSYSNRFEIRLFLQRTKIIPYEKIKNIDVKIYFPSFENLFINKFKKECRVFFNNSIYSFYFFYPVDGYFDNIENDLSKDKEVLMRRCNAKREKIEFLLKKLHADFSINKQFLPDEAKIK